MKPCFQFRLSFEIIVFLYCRHKQKDTCYEGSFFIFYNWIVSLVFGRGKCRKWWIHRWEHLWQFMLGSTAVYRKLKIQIFNYSCSSTASTKWNTVAIKVLLLFFKAVFWVFDTGFNESESESESWICWLLQQGTGKVSYLTYSFSGAASKVSLSNIYSFCLALVLLLSQA